MKPYGNKSGNSGITAYEFTDNGIRVMFEDGGVYHYTNESSGKINIIIMKKIAANGIGLTTFINQRIGNGYAEKSA